MRNKGKKDAKALVMGILNVHVCASCLRKPVNKSPSTNVRYYLGAKQKDKADTATSKKVKGKRGGDAPRKGRLAPERISWM